MLVNLLQHEVMYGTTEFTTTIVLLETFFLAMAALGAFIYTRASRI